MRHRYAHCSWNQDAYIVPNSFWIIGRLDMWTLWLKHSSNKEDKYEWLVSLFSYSLLGWAFLLLLTALVLACLSSCSPHTCCVNEDIAKLRNKLRPPNPCVPFSVMPCSLWQKQAATKPILLTARQSIARWPWAQQCTSLMLMHTKTWSTATCGPILWHSNPANWISLGAGAGQLLPQLARWLPYLQISLEAATKRCRTVL